MTTNVFAVALLFLTFLSFTNSTFAQELRSMGKTERMDGKLYLMIEGKRSRIGEDVVVVKLKPSVSETDSSLNVIRKSKLGYIDLKVPENKDIFEFIEELDKSGNFDYIDYDLLLQPCVSTNDTYVNLQGYLNRLDVGAAWSITTGSPTVKVAVLDTEIQCSHEDLGMGTDTYKNVDQSLGYNYIGSWTSNGWSHGTNVAGIIAAKTNNGKGVAGIAGGNNSQGVTIIPYCIGDEGGCHTYYIDDAIEDAVSTGAKIINMSFGDSNTLPSYVEQAIISAYNNGVTLVASSGNNVGNSVFYPAKYDQVIAVGGITGNYRASYANYGVGLDFVAPSTNVHTTDSANCYHSSSGTSLSAPQVTGVIALMLSVNPNLTPSGIKDILKRSAVKLPAYTYDYSGWNQEVGYGLVNALDAVLNSLPLHVGGPSLFCTQDVFTIYNLPPLANMAYNTTYSPSGFSFTISPNVSLVSYSAGSITLQKISNGKGNIKIYYKGNLMTTKEFWVGAPVPDDVYYEGGHFYIVTDPLCDADLFQYIVINGTKYKCLGGMSSSVFLSNGTYNAEVILKNDCGESHTYWPIVVGNSGYYSIGYVNDDHQVAIKTVAEHENIANKSNSTIAYILQSVSSGRIIAEGVLPITGGVINFSHVKRGQYVLVIKPDGKESESFKLSLN